MIDYNYHTHTFRCGHATGTEREYIENAIAIGMKVFCFSDHIIFGYKSHEEEEKFNDYIDTINKLKEEYKDKIEIHLGFECEYFPHRRNYFEYLLEETDVEYLILGQHYVNIGHHETGFMFRKLEHPNKVLKSYYSLIKKAFKTGLFCYLAHPDLYVRQCSPETDLFKKYARKICLLAKKYNIPLEINLNGLDKQKSGSKKPGYPVEEFWKIAGEIGNDVMIGIDAHSAELVKDAQYERAEELIKKYNLHHITRLNFKNK